MGKESRQAARGWRQWREEDARDALAEFATPDHAPPRPLGTAARVPRNTQVPQGATGPTPTWNGATEGLPTKIDPNGVIRVYDPSTNTFGAFNPDGTTRTFFTPSSPTYWLRQPGVEPWSPGGGH